MSTIRIRRALLAALLVTLPLAAPRTASAQQGGGSGAGGAGAGAEILRGRVFGEDGKTPVVGATVKVIAVRSHIERTAKTNKNGVYTVMFTESTGDYVVQAKAIGYTPKRIRVSRSDPNDNIIVGDFALDRKSIQLDTVVVAARGGSGGAGGNGDDDDPIGGNDRDALQRRLFSLDPSDLRSLMRDMPGVVYKNGGYSVMGASPDQNNTIVDGMTYKGSRLPSDAIKDVTTRSATFDPAQGQFAGGQTVANTRGGSNRWEQTIRGSLQDPRLSWQYGDPISLPQRMWTGGGNLSGPLKKNVAFLALSGEMNETDGPVQSLLNMSRAALLQTGLLPDTLHRTSDALGALGVPLGSKAVPNRTSSSNGSVFSRIDLMPKPALALQINLARSWGNQDGAGIGQMNYPASGTGARTATSNASISASGQVGKVLHQTSASINKLTSRNMPYLALPSGSVLVGSKFYDGRTGLTPLQFGGSTSGRSFSNSTQWSLKNSLSWLTDDSRHKITLTGEAGRDYNTNRTVTDQYGSYTYQSIAALEANTPTQYTRLLSSQDRSSSATTFAFSLGDRWRASRAWRFQYGARVDIARSSVHVPYNPVVDTLFGRRTDHVPFDVGLSPRFGFAWTQQKAKQKAKRRGEPESPLMVDDGMPIESMRYMNDPSGRTPLTVSGGIGAFRGILQPAEIASLADATGLPSAVRRLTCVGTTTPIPVWNRFGTDESAIPDQCLDGTGAATEFSTDKPTVRLYDPAFHAPLRWEADLALNGIKVRKWSLGVSTQASLGLNNQSTIDLNFRHIPVFALAGEGNRPMYVPIDAIVPTTAAIAPMASRVSDRFGAVTTTVSDLRNSVLQMTVTGQRVQPFFGRVPVNFQYTIARNRAQVRNGLGLDPLERLWSVGDAPVHTLTLGTNFPFWKFNFSTQLQVSSGRPYTPVVNGDVNGDGLAGDRAFVFDPATVGDSALAADLQSLLDKSPSARACLRRQMGQIAGVNSCRTGWTFVPSVNVDLNGLIYGNRFTQYLDPSKHINRGRNRFSFSVTTQNGLQTVLSALRLTQTSFGRAAIAPNLDPSLFYVDGFDPVAQRFHYRVNQQFGETRHRIRQARGVSLAPPFQVVFNGSLRLGGETTPSMAEGMGLVAPPKAPDLTPEQVKEQVRKLTMNPVGLVLAMRDSLLLTKEQIADVEKLKADFDARVDGTLAPVVDYVVKEGRNADDGELMKRISKAQRKMQDAMIGAARDVAEKLTPEQRKQLPPYLQFYMNKKA